MRVATLFSGKELRAEIFESTAAKTNHRTRPTDGDERVHVLSGKLILTGANRTVHECHPGDSLVLPAGYTGTWEMQGDYRELAVLMQKSKWRVARSLTRNGVAAGSTIADPPHRSARARLLMRFCSVYCFCEPLLIVRGCGHLLRRSLCFIRIREERGDAIVECEFHSQSRNLPCLSTLAFISAAFFDVFTLASQSAMYFFMNAIAEMSCFAPGP